MDITAAFAPIGRVNFNMALAEEHRVKFRRTLIYGGLRVLGGDSFITDLETAQAYVDSVQDRAFDVLVAFYGTFADSKMLSLIAEQIDRPIFLWALPEAPNGDRLELNSLCGVNLGAHSLRLKNIPYGYAYAASDDMQAVHKIRTLGTAGRIVESLKQTRIGVWGQYPAGMDSCILDRPALEEKLGVQVIEYPLDDVFEQIRSVDAAAVAPVKTRLAARIDGLDELDPAQVDGTLSAYLAMKETVRQDQLQGLAVRCWPEFFEEMKCSVCGAVSMMTNEMVPTGCEADINGTITDLILQLASGGTAFSTDVVVSDAQQDATVVWHCGQAPLAMADPGEKPRATVHSNRKLALLMEFTLKPGPVTVARLSRATGELRLVLGRGTILKGEKSFSGTSGLLRFERPAGQVLDTILSEGLEHHLSLTYGDHFDVLESVARMLGIPTLLL
jgi:L-fucose isomerase-like protein